MYRGTPKAVPPYNGDMGRLRFALLVAVILVVGHDLTYAAGNGVGGLGEALRGAGHDGYWAPTVLLVVGLAAIGVAAIVWQRGRLVRRMRALEARRRRTGLHAAFGAPTLWLAIRLLAVALATFIAQENLEHYTTQGGHLPGLGVLADQGYAATLPIFAGLAAILAALARYTAADRASLVAAIAHARSLPRAHDRIHIRFPQWVNLPLAGSIAARPNLGRAPPLVLLP